MLIPIQIEASNRQMQRWQLQEPIGKLGSAFKGE